MTTSVPTDRPGPISARPVRHPGRWVALVVIAVLVGDDDQLVRHERQVELVLRVPDHDPEARRARAVDGHDRRHRRRDGRGHRPGHPAGHHADVGQPRAARRRLRLHVVLPRDPALRPALAVRGRHRLPRINIGLRRSACRSDVTTDFFTLDYQAYSSTVWIGGLGLGLSEAAYMAEIARAGILSVDRGQAEAAQALGHVPGQDDAADRPSPGDAGHRPADRQRDHRHGQGHLAVHRRPDHSRALLPGDADRLADLPDHVRPAWRPPLWYLIICSILMVGQ